MIVRNIVLMISMIFLRVFFWKCPVWHVIWREYQGLWKVHLGKKICIITLDQHYYICFLSLSAHFPPFSVEIETSLEAFPDHLFLSLWCINSFRCGTDFSVCGQKKIK